jgi:hypothetical protein
MDYTYINIIICNQFPPLSVCALTHGVYVSAVWDEFMYNVCACVRVCVCVCACACACVCVHHL